jgi:hypothetical protein
MQTMLDPALIRKSETKQIELLLGALRRERERSAEVQTKFEFLMKEHRTKVEKNLQLIRANEKLVESHQEVESYIKDVESEKSDLEARLKAAEAKAESYKKESQTLAS